MSRIVFILFMIATVAAMPAYAQVKLSPEEALRQLEEKQQSLEKDSFISDTAFDKFVANKELFIEIPINGTIGEDVRADAIEEILEYCANDPHIGHVVFTINSPGGMVLEAERMMNAMQKHSDKLYYHAVVEHAISAAIWIVFGCDTVWVKPGSTIGGAVIYQQSTTGSVHVDEKMSSIFLAKVTATAQDKGHPKALARAMVLATEELYAYEDNDGKMQLVNRKPVNIPPSKIQTIDTKTTVVTLTRDKAVELQFARAYDGAADDLGKSLRLKNWVRANNYGHVAMIMMGLEEVVGMQAEYIEMIPEPRGRTNTRTRKLLQNLKSDMRNLATSLTEARKNDPERILHIYDPITKKTMTPDAEAWREQIRQARRHWAGTVAFWKRVGDATDNKDYTWKEGFDTLSKGFHRIKDIETDGYAASDEFFGSVNKNTAGADAEKQKTDTSNTTKKKKPLPGLDE